MLSVLLFGGADWTWAEGAVYWEGWVGFIALLVPTLLANVLTFVLVTYSPRLNRSSSSIMVRYLSMEDAAFSLCCLVQCALNLSELRIVGERAGCEAQAIYALFFMLSTGYTLCCIAYNSEQKISVRPGLAPRQVLLIHCAIWLWSALIAVLSSLVLAPARIMPSATYCLVSLVSLQAGLVFYVPGVLLICAFLSHRYFLIYCHVTRGTDELVSAYAQQRRQAQTRQMEVAKRMLVLVLAYFLCAVPVLLLAVYECIVNADAPPVAYLVAGHLIHLNSLLNPILYVWMSTQTRAALWDMLSRRHSSQGSLRKQDGAQAADKTATVPEPKSGDKAAETARLGAAARKRSEQLEAGTELSHGLAHSTRVMPLSQLPQADSGCEGASPETGSARLISLGLSDSGTALSSRLSPLQDGSVLQQPPPSASPGESNTGSPSANSLQPSVNLPIIGSRLSSSARVTQAVRGLGPEAVFQFSLLPDSAQQHSLLGSAAAAVDATTTKATLPFGVPQAS